MKVAALFRVSTERQENEGASLPAQERRFHELAGTQGWEIVAKFRGQESAAKAASERAVLQQLLACLRDNDVDAVWVIEQSRLTRGDELEVALLMRELRERRVAVIVGTELRDLENVDQRMVFRIHSAVDAAERDRIRERMQRGRREKARRGRKAGGAAPYGYRNPPAGDPLRGTLQPEPDEAAVVARIFRDLAAGVSLRRLAEQLTREGIAAPRGGAWGRTTIRRLLESPVYLGTQVCGVWQVAPGTGTVRLDLHHPEAIVVPGAHPALVTEAERSAAISQLHGNSNGRPGLLTGMLWVNGERSWIDGGHGASFYCPASRTPGAWLRVEELNRLVWSGFVRLFSHPEAVARIFRAARRRAAAQSLAAELAALTRRRSRLEARLERLVELRADGEISRTEHAERAAAARRALRETAEAERSLRARIEAVSGGHFERALAALRLLVTDGLLSVDQKRRALRRVVETVHVQAEAREDPQARSERGRFAAATSPRWRASDVFLRLRPLPEPATTVSPCGRNPTGRLVQIVRAGELVALPQLEPARRRAAGGRR